MYYTNIEDYEHLMTISEQARARHAPRGASATIAGMLWKGLVAVLMLASFSVQAGNSFQEKMLFSPPEYMLKAEQRGRIMIYDGLDSKLIDRALDEQFDRIDNMMFVRVAHVQDTGDIEYEEDGCD